MFAHAASALLRVSAAHLVRRTSAACSLAGALPSRPRPQAPVRLPGGLSQDILCRVTFMEDSQVDPSTLISWWAVWIRPSGLKVAVAQVPWRVQVQTPSCSVSAETVVVPRPSFRGRRGSRTGIRRSQRRVR